MNNNKTNRIEVDKIHIRQTDYVKSNNVKESRRLLPTIGNKISNIEKYHTDILGNMYKQQRPKAPQLVFKKG
ncbi:hypothetical protein MUA26_04810 [Staphylococcus sp. IVB6246]|uniref:hypothetical protein n=1 Tax=Staphylococcus sp. IVB6246 TaxID=2989772 RepID=UPI0021D02251|nr:hypothetical protein [Staphylococcus sp. IVB6246]UXR70452.1 hypothetical protein MUA26_04810 [Staphylococcus sp. IVB6246]